MDFIDAHAHLSFFKNSANVAQFLKSQESQGITRWINGGYDLEDWRSQITLQSSFRHNLILGFGLHPWAILEKSDSVVEGELLQLRAMLRQAQFMGEIGLDFFSTKDEAQKGRQIKYFIEQLKFSEQVPLILHVVQAHAQAIESLDSIDRSFTGIVHGYSGSLEAAEEYIKRGFLISIGRGVLNEGFKKLRRVVKECSLKHMVVESDYPTSRAAIDEDYQFLKVAEKIAEIKSLSTDMVLTTSRDNLLKILGEAR